MSDETDQAAGPIVEAFGGIRPMATKLGAPVSTVQGWKQRDTIPAGRMAEIRKIAAENGITLPLPDTTPAKTDSAETSDAAADTAADTANGTTDGTSRQTTDVKESTSKTQKSQTTTAPAEGSGANPRNKEQTGSRSGGGLATGLSVLAILVALGGAGWLWWSTEGPGADSAENSRISALEGRVVRLAESTAADPGKPGRDALAAQLESLRAEIENLSGRDVSGDIDPLRAELTALAGQVRQLEAVGVGAGDPAIAQRLDDLEAGLRSASELAAADLKTVSGGLAAFTARLEALEARAAALEEQFTGFARDGAQDEAAALAAIRVSLLANRLRQAFERGEPYRDVLAALESTAGDDPVLSGVAIRLAPYADTGVATRDELLFAFPDTAVAILDNAPADAESDIVDEILDRARRMVRVRRVGTDMPADSVDGRIARAERRLNAGDVAGAVTVLEEFEAPAGAAAEPWLERARAHVQLQSALETLDAHVLTRLTGAGGAE